MLRGFLLRVHDPFSSPHFSWAGEIQLLLVVARKSEDFSNYPILPWIQVLEAPCQLHQQQVSGWAVRGYSESMQINRSNCTFSLWQLYVFAQLSAGHWPQLTLRGWDWELLLGGGFLPEQNENRRIKVHWQELCRESLQGLLSVGLCWFNKVPPCKPVLFTSCAKGRQWISYTSMARSPKRPAELAST